MLRGLDLKDAWGVELRGFRMHTLRIHVPIWYILGP